MELEVLLAELREARRRLHAEHDGECIQCETGYPCETVDAIDGEIIMITMTGDS